MVSSYPHLRERGLWVLFHFMSTGGTCWVPAEGTPLGDKVCLKAFMGPDHLVICRCHVADPQPRVEVSQMPSYFLPFGG